MHLIVAQKIKPWFNRLMPITAKQTKNSNWGFEVVQERLLRASGNNAPIYANVRTDTDEVLELAHQRSPVERDAERTAMRVHERLR